VKPPVALACVNERVARLHGVPRTCRGGVALTFDDGPHPQGTPAVLEALAARGARATFFLVGEQVQRRPALAAEILAAGHAVGVHAHRHRCQLRLTPKQLADDLARAVDAIATATGVAPELHRPPYGIYSAAGLRLARERVAPILWSRWGKDWRRLTTPSRIANRAAARIAEGDVILLHDADFYSARGSWRRTAAALPLVIESVMSNKLSTLSLRRDVLGWPSRQNSSR
jgi:peptidoglycan/xylan/chitin deacetylase (PgdA/CDA1 family)